MMHPHLFLIICSLSVPRDTVRSPLGRLVPILEDEVALVLERNLPGDATEVSVERGAAAATSLQVLSRTWDRGGGADFMSADIVCLVQTYI